MDLKELNSIDINNPEQVKRVQEFLKKQGYYTRTIDGNWGEGTAKARKDFSAAEAERQAREAKDADARAKREEEARDRQAVRDREAADAKSKRDKEEADARAIREEEAASKKRERDIQTGIVTAGSVAGGLGLGLGGGKLADVLANRAIKGEMTARAGELSKLAGTSRAINPTDSKLARALHQDVVSAADRGRLTKTPLPWGTTATGLGLLGMGAYSSFDRAPNAKSDIERAIWTGTGYGELTSGAKMLADSLRRYKNPGVAYPADDLAAIESSRRIASGGPVTAVAPPASSEAYAPKLPPEPAAAPAAAANAPADPQPPMRHGDRLRDAARAVGAGSRGTKATYADAVKKGLSAENMPAVAEALNLPKDAARSTILQRLRELKGIGGKMVIPLAAGALAYDAMTSPADASTGEDFKPNRAAGAAAAATGAGATYGGMKLADVIAKYAPGAMKAVGSGMSMMMPSMAADMTDASPEDLNMARNQMARTLPSMLRGGAVEDAYQMAQVPERSPVNAGPRVAQEAPEGSFSPQINGRVARMLQMGATPEQVAAFLNSAVR